MVKPYDGRKGQHSESNYELKLAKQERRYATRRASDLEPLKVGLKTATNPSRSREVLKV